MGLRAADGYRNARRGDVIATLLTLVKRRMYYTVVTVEAIVSTTVSIYFIQIYRVYQSGWAAIWSGSSASSNK